LKQEKLIIYGSCSQAAEITGSSRWFIYFVCFVRSKYSRKSTTDLTWPLDGAAICRYVSGNRALAHQVESQGGDRLVELVVRKQSS
jgi:hypothetical protein